jgi:hypothetical protein
MHLPSRVRSMVWLRSALPIMAEYGHSIGNAEQLRVLLAAWLPQEPRRRALAANA